MARGDQMVVGDAVVRVGVGMGTTLDVLDVLDGLELELELVLVLVVVWRLVRWRS